MKRLSIRYIRPRIISLGNVSLKKQYFFCSKKHEPFAGGSIQCNVSNDNFNDVEFDENISSAMTFDLSVDDTKWKEREENEFQFFVKSVEESTVSEGKGFKGVEDGKSTYNDETVLGEAHDIPTSAQLIRVKLSGNIQTVESIEAMLEILRKKESTLLEMEDEYITKFFDLIYKHLDKIPCEHLICLLNIMHSACMKNKIRDLSYEVIKHLRKDHKLKNYRDKQEEKEAIKMCLYFLHILNLNSLYISEFYDELFHKINYMSSEELTAFARVCFVHSLRTKHYLDKVVYVCIEKIIEFDINELQSLFHSFHRFCKEYIAFYDASLSEIVRNLDSFDLPFYHLLLKIATNFRHEQRYLDLTARVSERLAAWVGGKGVSTGMEGSKGEERETGDSATAPATAATAPATVPSTAPVTAPATAFASTPPPLSTPTSHSTVVQVVKCLKYLQYSKHNHVEVKNAVNSIYELMNENPQCVHHLDVEDVVYAIVCFSTYNKRIILYNHLLDVLCKRSNDLLHAKNISLWMLPALSLSKISWFHKNYFQTLFGYIRDYYVLNRLNVFQMLKLLSSIVKMNIYDEEIYKILIENLYKEWDVIKKKLLDIATFLWSCAYVNIIYEPLFDSAYKLVIDILMKNNLSTNNVVYKNCFVNITWSFIVANYHKKSINFEKILDVTFSNRDPNDSQAFKRLHQIADACFREVPKCLLNVQCLDILYQYCMHTKCKLLRNDFNIYKKEKDAIKIRKKITDELEMILRNFCISYDLHFEPYHNAPYTIDIVLNGQMKIGICIFGKEHLMRTMHKTHWDYLNNGFVSLQMRILHAHGWKVC
ncbi:RAP protein, putative [Plasmodium ovale wallikeri]|uniref:RAP protein, putative n=1 Tax=Plasmodium ovale wallikeri TaxID=864142 RepID=A0A1A8YYR8_PLAOA|nr:RAP protein, putative [Plasmodium ovale wallikeri]SBT36724.1 RAP protein, putative [Plasmodium ovale wallikeri]